MFSFLPLLLLWTLSLEMFCCKHFPITSSFAFSLHAFVWMLFFLVFFFLLSFDVSDDGYSNSCGCECGCSHGWCCHFCYSATYFPAYVVVMRCFSSVTLTFLGLARAALLLSEMCMKSAESISFFHFVFLFFFF